MEVDLGPGHIVLGGDPAFPLEKRHIPHFLSPVYFGQTAGWIKMPLGTVVGLGQRHIVVDGDPAPPSKGTHTSRNFWTMSNAAKRSPISATVEHL